MSPLLQVIPPRPLSSISGVVVHSRNRSTSPPSVAGDTPTSPLLHLWCGRTLPEAFNFSSLCCRWYPHLPSPPSLVWSYTPGTVQLLLPLLQVIPPPLLSFIFGVVVLSRKHSTSPPSVAGDTPTSPLLHLWCGRTLPEPFNFSSLCCRWYPHLSSPSSLVWSYSPGSIQLLLPLLQVIPPRPLSSISGVVVHSRNRSTSPPSVAGDTPTSPLLHLWCGRTLPEPFNFSSLCCRWYPHLSSPPSLVWSYTPGTVQLLLPLLQVIPPPLLSSISGVVVHSRNRSTSPPSVAGDTPTSPLLHLWCGRTLPEPFNFSSLCCRWYPHLSSPPSLVWSYSPGSIQLLLPLLQVIPPPLLSSISGVVVLSRKHSTSPPSVAGDTPTSPLLHLWCGHTLPEPFKFSSLCCRWYPHLSSPSSLVWSYSPGSIQLLLPLLQVIPPPLLSSISGVVVHSRNRSTSPPSVAGDTPTSSLFHLWCGRTLPEPFNFSSLCCRWYPHLSSPPSLVWSYTPGTVQLLLPLLQVIPPPLLSSISGVVVHSRNRSTSPPSVAGDTPTSSLFHLWCGRTLPEPFNFSSLSCRWYPHLFSLPSLVWSYSPGSIQLLLPLLQVIPPPLLSSISGVVVHSRNRSTSPPSVAGDTPTSPLLHLWCGRTLPEAFNLSLCYRWYHHLYSPPSLVWSYTPGTVQLLLPLLQVIPPPLLSSISGVILQSRKHSTPPPFVAGDTPTSPLLHLWCDSTVPEAFNSSFCCRWYPHLSSPPSLVWFYSPGSIQLLLLLLQVIPPPLPSSISGVILQSRKHSTPPPSVAGDTPTSPLLHLWCDSTVPEAFNFSSLCCRWYPHLSSLPSLVWFYSPGSIQLLLPLLQVIPPPLLSSISGVVVHSRNHLTLPPASCTSASRATTVSTLADFGCATILSYLVSGVR